MSEAARRFKDAAYDQLARIGKATAAPKRLELLDLLCQGPRTVEALAEHADLSVANASAHLKVLKAAQLVDTTRKGTFIEYRIAHEDVAGFVVALRKLAHTRLAELARVTREFMDARGDIESVDENELVRRVREGKVTVLDVRPEEEYRAGHLPGALSIPVSQLRRRLDELPKRREVVAYCRGPYCVMAIDAVRLLRKHGLVAHRLEHGVAEWRARGWRVEVGPTGGHA